MAAIQSFRTMKTKTFLIVLLILISPNLFGQSILIPDKGITYYYGIELNGVLCGYNEEILERLSDGSNLISMVNHATVLQSVLGGSADLRIESTTLFDLESGQYSMLDSDIYQGSLHVGSSIQVENGNAQYHNKLNGEQKDIALTDSVILDNGTFMVYLLNLPKEVGIEHSFQFVDAMKGELDIHEVSFLGHEEIQVNGKKRTALKFKELFKSTGISGEVWIDERSGQVLKRIFSSGRTIFLSDESVKKKIKVAKLDDVIFAKVNKVIPNILDLSYLRVEAKINTAGEWVTAESLNFPGQTFTGTVDENYIVGTFEIAHKRYDGAQAPLFPTNYSLIDDLKKYLEPEDYIESDDPIILAKAQEITKGAKTAWEAATRITTWVSKHVNYTIPGGITARKTLETAQGECGAHSRLTAALCRAVGIPAKFVIGCMYTNSYGGTFGQHAWNEIYMGPAGWIPVDATASEFDFIDSGHIRLGEKSSFIPEEMEIIEYRHFDDKAAQTEDIPEPFVNLVGEYKGPVTGKAFKVLYEDEGLSVAIPDQITVALFDENEEGYWVAKMTNQLFFSFEYEESGKTKNMHLHQLMIAPRNGEPDTIPEDVPEKFRPYLGTYYLAAGPFEVEVVYDDNGLAVDDPNQEKLVHLQAPDESGLWMDEFNDNGIRFKRDDSGKVTQLIVVQDFVMPRMN